MINGSVIMYDGIIEMTKSMMTKTVSAKRFPVNLNEEKVIFKIKNVYILLAFFYLPWRY